MKQHRTKPGGRTFPAQPAAQRHPVVQHPSRLLPTHLLTLLLTLLVAVLLATSTTALSITSITAPQTIHEGELLTLRFTTDEPASQAILEDGVLLSTNATYSRLLGYDEAGSHVFTFTATGQNGTTGENRTVEVLDTPLAFTLDEPSAEDYTTSTIPVSLQTTIPADACYVKSGSTTHTLTRENATGFDGSVTLADGLHTLTVKCDRNGELATQEVTLKVDTTPPTISLGPRGTVHDALLTATTDEVSDCRYGTSLAPYDQLPHAFPQNASLTHEQHLDLAEGSYTYTVACRDVYGNTAAPVTTSFTLSRPPSATISVEGENPHKAGKYAVTLETSEPLAAMPTLTLTYQGGGSQRLSLTEETPTRYSGLLLIPEDAGEEVGSFTWSGTDLDGNKGSKITDGTLFVVDTVKPAKVETFTAVNDTGGVNLTWYYDSEDKVTFNLYRSTSPGVDYTDFLATTTGDEYHDADTTTAVKYYYRIAAVDKAGNVGPLSHEEWASPAAAQYAATGAGDLLDPVLQVGLDKRIHELDSTILDGEQALRDLAAAHDKSVSRVISVFRLTATASKAVATMKSVRSDLEGLRRLDLSRSEYETRVTALQQRADAARRSLPVKVSVGDQTEYDETPSQAALTAAADRLLADNPLSSSERAAYDEKVAALNDAVRVLVTATHATITTADGIAQAYTIVQKELLAQQPVSDVVAVETIPKGFAQSASVLDFLGKKPVILKQDPIVQYSYPSLSDETIRYAVKGSVPFPTVRESALALLRKATGAVRSTTAAADSRVTGSATSFIGAVTGGQGLLVLFGILVIAGLLVYYFTMPDGEAEPATGTSPAFTSSAQLMATPALPTTPPIQTILVERSKEPLVGLLRRGHELIDETRYPDALHFYKRALARYAEERFPSSRMELAVKEELAALYRKLALFDTMLRAHDVAYAGDARQLTSLLEAMREHAAAIEDRESKLVEKAQAEYAYLYRQLNRLQREKLEGLRAQASPEER